ncbi:MAG: prolyl oligopeptidase family serine peptidase [Bacteroidales bacterium]|nr:prolyl oligopeptidase family serine peptidase [Bacteroidales bacterium]
MKHLIFAFTFAAMFINTNAQDPLVMEKSLKLSNGSKLLYTLSLPAGLKKKQPVPLIIALHWGWDQSQPLPDYYGKAFMDGLILPAFENTGAIIIAPDCPSEKWHNEESEIAVLELMDHIIMKHTIDSGQIFITGFSAGGFGTWYMASRHPEKFSMAIPVASKPYEQWTEEWPGLPVFIINGTNDELFPFDEIQEMVSGLESKEVRVKLIKVEGATHYDTGKYITPLKYAFTWFKGN